MTDEITIKKADKKEDLTDVFSSNSNDEVEQIEDSTEESIVSTHRQEENKEEKVDDDLITIQFRYKKYQMILDILDDLKSEEHGTPQGRVLHARNWRLVLNLKVPEDKEVYEELLKSQQYKADFWILRKVDKHDRIKDRAQTLKKLQSMSRAQLMSFLTQKEMIDAGLLPGEPDPSELIMLIIDNKRLEM